MQIRPHGKLPPTSAKKFGLSPVMLWTTPPSEPNTEGLLRLRPPRQEPGNTGGRASRAPLPSPSVRRLLSRSGSGFVLVGRSRRRTLDVRCQALEPDVRSYRSRSYVEFMPNYVEVMSKSCLGLCRTHVGPEGMSRRAELARPLHGLLGPQFGVV